MTLETKAISRPTEPPIEQISRLSEQDQPFGLMDQKESDPSLLTIDLNDRLDSLMSTVEEQKSVIERLAARSARPTLQTTHASEPSEAKAAFDDYVRRGITEAPSLKHISGSDSSGGIIAPEETATLIDAGLRSISPFRQIATVRKISGNTYRKPMQTEGFSASWSGENNHRTETSTPTLQAFDFPAMELYAMPAATQSLLDDAIVDVGQWIADEVQISFASQESKAFIAGNGVNKPKGILSYSMAPEASRSFTQLGTVAAAGSTVTGDDLIDLIYTLGQAYRANGHFIMNRQTAAAVRKLKDNDGSYLWSPGLSAGQPATLLGYPVLESEDMHDIGSNSTPIAFGDFTRGYLIVDRAGIQVLRDPYSVKPFVLFYTTKRVGGGVQDYDAIKFLKMPS